MGAVGKNPPRRRPDFVAIGDFGRPRDQERPARDGDYVRVISRMLIERLSDGSVGVSKQLPDGTWSEFVSFEVFVARTVEQAKALLPDLCIP
jgi:hypothetical protein